MPAVALRPEDETRPARIHSLGGRRTGSPGTTVSASALTRGRPCLPNYRAHVKPACLHALKRELGEAGWFDPPVDLRLIAGDGPEVHVKAKYGSEIRIAAKYSEDGWQLELTDSVWLHTASIVS